MFQNIMIYYAYFYYLFYLLTINNIATTIKQYWIRYLSAELVSLSVECLSFASKQLTLLLNKYTNVIKHNRSSDDEGQSLRSK